MVATVFSSQQARFAGRYNPPELVTNGDFGTGDTTGWTQTNQAGATISVVGGAATAANTTSQTARLRQQITATAPGQTYRVTATGSGWNLVVGTTNGGADLLGAGVAGQSRTFTATGEVTWLNFATTVNGATLDNVSVKAV